MSKVVLTKAQAEALQAAILNGDAHNTLTYHAKRCFHTGADYTWVNEASELNNMSFDMVARAILGGYEVEPEFKVGGWAKDKIQTDEIGKIIQVQGDYIRMEILKGFSVIEVGRSLDSLVNVTSGEIAEEKERRSWAVIRRWPGRFLNGDLIELDDGSIKKVITVFDFPEETDSTIVFEDANEAYKNGKIIRVFPNESGMYL